MRSSTVKYTIFTLLLTACGRSGSPDPAPNYSPSATLLDRRDLYLSLVPTVQDSDGFIATDKCDSLLHTAILGAGGATVDILAARNDSGQWFRRPLSYSECLSAGESRSTLSRDMVTGLLTYWTATKNWVDAEDFFQYVQARGGKFGESDGTLEGNSRIYMSPDLYALLAEVIYRNGGPNHAVTRTLATRTLAKEDGFRAHLEALQGILWRHLTGSNSASERAFFTYQVTRVPKNAIFQYGAGNYAESEQLLLELFPSNRLPTTADTCNPLPYETDDYSPCPEQNKTHAGAQFLLLSKWLIEIGGHL